MIKFSFKKIAAAALSLTLAFSMVACNNGGAGGESSSPAESSTPTETPSVELPDFDYMGEDLTKYVTLGQYKGFEISISPMTAVTDGDVEEQIKYDLINSEIVNKITDRAVTEDDTVSISYKGFMDGEQFEGGTGDSDYFTIYDGGGFIDGFAEGLIGVMPGVETDLELTFPEDYYEDKAGKPVTFKVTVHHIYEAKELTDEVAAELTGNEDMTAEDLRADYRAKMEAKVAETYENAKINLAWEKIIESAEEIELPKDLVDGSYEVEIQYYKSLAAAYGMTYEEFLEAIGTTEDDIYNTAHDSIFAEMVIYSIIKAENITLTDEEYRERFDQLLEGLSSDYTEEDVLKVYSKEELTDMFIHTKTMELAATWQTYTVTEDSETEEPDFDFMGEDLTKYLVLGQYKGLTVEIPATPTVTDGDVQKSIDDSLMNAKICDKITDRPVTKDDTVSISYEGYMDGEQFEGGTGKSDFFTIYDGGGFIPGFADGLIRATPGEEVSVELTFPDNYYEELAGKPVTFKVTVHHIYEAKELTDEVAAELTGEEDMTAEALRAQCREILEEQAAEKYMNEKAQLVVKAILEAAESVDPPKELVESYYNIDVEYYKYYAKLFGMSYEDMLEYVGLTEESLYQRAEDNVMKDITVYSIIKAENVTLEDAEFEEMLSEMAESSGYTGEELIELYTKEELTATFTYSKVYEALESWQELVIAAE